MAAIRKQTAPANVPILTRKTFRGKPVSGITNAPTAEIPKKMEPNIFNPDMFHEKLRGCHDHREWLTSIQASKLAIRKQIDP